MRTKSKHACQFDALESRTYLSVVHDLHPRTGAEVRRPKPVAAPALAGTIAGSFNLANPTPVTGSGTVSPLGPVTVSGTIGGSLVAGGTIQSTLTLSETASPSNTVTVSVVGAIPRNVRRPPTVRVLVDGSSVFPSMAGETGTGTIKISNLASDFTSGSFVLTLRTTPRRA